MWDNYIGRQIRRTNRNLFLVNFALLLILAAVFAFNYRYAVNFLTGTEKIAVSDLLALPSAEARFHNFVEVTGEQAIPTGFQRIKRTTSGGSQVVLSETKSEYVALRIGRKFLLVEAKPGSQLTTYKGALIPVSESVRATLIVPTEKEVPAVKGAFLPFVLDSVAYRNDGYWGFGIGAVVFLFALWNLRKWLARNNNYEAHPIFAELAVRGEPNTLAQQIENEMPAAESIGSVTLTPNWLLSPSVFGLQLLLLDDIVWIYKKVTKHYSYFIPTGKSFAAMVADRHGLLAELSLKEGKADELLARLAARVPWALGGFDKELVSLWKTDPASLIAAVDERRTQAKAHAATAGS